MKTGQIIRKPERLVLQIVDGSQSDGHHLNCHSHCHRLRILHYILLLINEDLLVRESIGGSDEKEDHCANHLRPGSV